MVDDALLRVARAVAAADRGTSGSGVWDALTKDEQARYLVLSRTAVEEYLAYVGDARTAEGA